MISSQFHQLSLCFQGWKVNALLNINNFLAQHAQIWMENRCYYLWVSCINKSDIILGSCSYNPTWFKCKANNFFWFWHFSTGHDWECGPIPLFYDAFTSQRKYHLGKLIRKKSLPPFENRTLMLSLCFRERGSPGEEVTVRRKNQNSNSKAVFGHLEILWVRNDP